MTTVGRLGVMFIVWGIGMVIAYLILPGPSIWIGAGLFISAVCCLAAELTTRRQR